MGVTWESGAIPWHHPWDIAHPRVQSLAQAPVGASHLPSLGFSFSNNNVEIDTGVTKVLPAWMAASLGADSCGPRTSRPLARARSRPDAPTHDRALNGQPPPPANRGRRGAAAPGRLRGIQSRPLRAEVLGVPLRLLPPHPRILLSAPVVMPMSTGLECPALWAWAEEGSLDLEPEGLQKSFLPCPCL